MLLIGQVRYDLTVPRPDLCGATGLAERVWRIRDSIRIVFLRHPAVAIRLRRWIRMPRVTPDEAVTAR
jgi:hypothetical protein